MRFSDWVQLSEIHESAPPAPGLFQVRMREGLIRYPRGQSAMYYYGYAAQLSGDLTRFRDEILKQLAVDEETLLIRWMATADTVEQFKKYLDRFHAKFGSLPSGNALFLQKRTSAPKD